MGAINIRLETRSTPPQTFFQAMSVPIDVLETMMTAMRPKQNWQIATPIVGELCASGPPDASVYFCTRDAMLRYLQNLYCGMFPLATPLPEPSGPGDYVEAIIHQLYKLEVSPNSHITSLGHEEISPREIAERQANPITEQSLAAISQRSLSARYNRLDVLSPASPPEYLEAHGRFLTESCLTRAS